MVLGGEEGLDCEVCVNGICLEHVSEFKYLGCVLDESGMDEAECSWKVASGRRVAGAIRCLVNDRSLQLECARVLHDTLLMPVLTYGSDKETSRITAVQSNNLRGLLGIRRMDKCSDKAVVWLKKGVDEKIDEGIFQWFGMWRGWRTTG